MRRRAALITPQFAVRRGSAMRWGWISKTAKTRPSRKIGLPRRRCLPRRQIAESDLPTCPVGDARRRRILRLERRIGNRGFASGRCRTSSPRRRGRCGVRPRGIARHSRFPPKSMARRCPHADLGRAAASERTLPDSGGVVRNTSLEVPSAMESSPKLYGITPGQLARARGGERVRRAFRRVRRSWVFRKLPSDASSSACLRKTNPTVRPS